MKGPDDPSPDSVRCHPRAAHRWSGGRRARARHAARRKEAQHARRRARADGAPHPRPHLRAGSRPRRRPDRRGRPSRDRQPRHRWVGSLRAAGRRLVLRQHRHALPLPRTGAPQRWARHPAAGRAASEASPPAHAWHRVDPRREPPGHDRRRP